MTAHTPLTYLPHETATFARNCAFGIFAISSVVNVASRWVSEKCVFVRVGAVPESASVRDGMIPTDCFPLARRAWTDHSAERRGMAIAASFVRKGADRASFDSYAAASEG
jgi:hypothetical protein